MKHKRPLIRLVQTEESVDQRQRERDLHLFGVEPGTDLGDMIALAAFLFVMLAALVAVIVVSVKDVVSR
jgi:hypothetical protein